jgi:hypothetical protein
MDAFDTLPMASEPITTAEAYRAMLEVMEYYYRLGSEENQIGNMLSDLSPGVWADGTPGDPAAWSLWLKAIAGTLRQPNKFGPLS